MIYYQSHCDGEVTGYGPADHISPVPVFNYMN